VYVYSVETKETLITPLYILQGKCYRWMDRLMDRWQMDTHGQTLQALCTYY